LLRRENNPLGPTYIFVEWVMLMMKAISTIIIVQFHDNILLPPEQLLFQCLKSLTNVKKRLHLTVYIKNGDTLEEANDKKRKTSDKTVEQVEDIKSALNTIIDNSCIVLSLGRLIRNNYKMYLLRDVQSTDFRFWGCPLKLVVFFISL